MLATCRCLLSIPLWCDWDMKGKIVLGWRVMTFNPTVVRLGQEPLGQKREQAALLSIPLWCDWDLQPNPRPGRGGVSFNPTVVRLGPGRAGPCSCPSSPLSIPLWCDWDKAQAAGEGGGEAGFQSHCGAIGTTAPSGWARGPGRPFNPTVVRLGQGG